MGRSHDDAALPTIPRRRGTSAMSEEIRTPRVSVVMGVGGRPRDLHHSVESILSQAGISFEFIVVDDGSGGDAPCVLDALAREGRIRLLRQTNQGLTRALVRGCAQACGEFIARQDVGDLSLPGRLARQVEALDRDATLVMVSCWARAVGPQDEPLYDVRRPENPAEATRALTAWQGPPHHGSMMFRRSAYERAGGYRPQFYFSQDSDLWLRLVELGRIGYVQEFLYSFRVTEGSISSRHRRLQHQLGLVSHACREARLNGRSEADLLARAEALRPTAENADPADSGDAAYFIGRCLMRNRDPRARRYLETVVARHPWRLKARLALLQCALVCPPVEQDA